LNADNDCFDCQQLPLLKKLNEDGKNRNVAVKDVGAVKKNFSVGRIFKVLLTLKAEDGTS